MHVTGPTTSTGPDQHHPPEPEPEPEPPVPEPTPPEPPTPPDIAPARAKLVTEETVDDDGFGVPDWIQTAVDSIEFPDLPSRNDFLNEVFRGLLSGPITAEIADEIVRIATTYLYIEGREHFGGYAHDDLGGIKTSATAALDGLTGLVAQFKAAGHEWPYLAAVEELFDGTTVFAAAAVDSVVPGDATPAGDLVLPVVGLGVGSAPGPTPSPSPVVPANNVYADAQANIRGVLLDLGLDGAIASDVPLYIVDIDANHAVTILNSLDGETSLVRGAPVSIHTPIPEVSTVQTSPDLQQLVADGEVLSSTPIDEISYADAVKRMFIDDVLFNLETTSVLQQMSLSHGDVGPGFINISVGRNPLLAINGIMQLYDASPAGSPLRTEIDTAFEQRYGAPPTGNNEDLILLRQMFLDDLRLEAQAPHNAALLGESEAILSQQIIDMRQQQGLMLFVSGGNAGDDALELVADVGASVSQWTFIEPAIVVGAFSFGSASNGDEYRAGFASAGVVDFLGPGVDIPVSPGPNANTAGASLAAPYIMQIAYLIYMDRVNRGLPPPTPDEIEAILKSPAVNQDIVSGGTTLSAPDPVYAVLASRGFTTRDAMQAELDARGILYWPHVAPPRTSPTLVPEGAREEPFQ